jgi:uncharacterized membrane protein
MNNAYVPAVGIGMVAGVRSMSAPAMVSRYLRREEHESNDRLTELLSSPIVSRVLQAAAAAEMAADKTSWVPDRTAWPSVAWRAVAGGVAGSIVAGTEGGSRLVGAALGAAGAVAATFAAFYLREALHRRLKLSHRVLGAAEDSVVVGAGRRLLAVS